MNKDLSIVIPVFNKFAFTKSCLDDLRQLPDNHEIIIVDNGSTDETRSLELDSRIRYIRNEENLGFAKASNIGYVASIHDNVMFLNNDIRVKSEHSTWTSSILDRCDERALIGPTMGQLDNNLNFKQERNGILTGNAYMSGWCLTANKAIWSELILSEYQGPFSEEFGIAYFEDTDLGFRARSSRINFVVVDVPVIHFGKQTSKQLNTHQLYNGARNIFVKKWKK